MAKASRFADRNVELGGAAERFACWSQPALAPGLKVDLSKGSRDMRVMMQAATIVAIALFSSTVNASDRCSDRNELNGISVDARLVAIKLYYHGFIGGLTDEKRKSCYEAHALNDDKLAVVNKVLELVERDCLSIASAARIVAEGACP